MSGWLDPFIIFIFYKIENNEALNKYIHIGIYNSIINMTEINQSFYQENNKLVLSA